MEILKISANSNPNAIAGAIAGALRKMDRVEAHAIGAGAVNQVVKAIAIARRLIEGEGGDEIKMIPAFMDIRIDDQEKTAIRFIIERPT
ncbi:MAG: stage V sporulation protein S [Candidatus Bipolaricaulia bacterium]